MYVVLLEMVVFPFIVSSLLHALGSLRFATALKLLRAGWPAFLLAWGGTLAALGLLAQAIPQARPAHRRHRRSRPRCFATSLSLVPAHPFADLSRNCVPAIVAFCVFYGIAIQRIENKQGILSGLEVVKHASVTIWKWVVRMARLVFSLCSLTSRGRSDWKLSETFVCRRSFQSRLRRHVRYKQVTAVRFSRMGRDRGNADATL